MSSPPVTIDQDRPVRDAAELMLARNIGALVVVDADGRYSGVLTEQSFMPRASNLPFVREAIFRVMGVLVADAGDVEEAVELNQGKPIREVMDARCPTARPDATAYELAKIMLDLEINHVPIVEDGRPVGMVSRHDFLRLFAKHEG